LDHNVGVLPSWVRGLGGGSRAAARAVAVLVFAALVAGAAPACSGGGSRGLPPPPATPRQDLGPSEPPVIWIAGTLTRLAPDRLEVREPAGSVVSLRRLAASATRFFRVDGDRWRTVAASEVRTGDDLCVETLMDGPRLLALRVFLGAGCGPA
jgi:hypothetical protein